mgnify:CR=1 FL=1
MTAALTKFDPVPTPETQAFWDGCREHRLLIQRCTTCGHVQFYPRGFCTQCGRRNPGWVQASGRGTVATYTVVRTPVSPAYAGDVPYVIGLIRLEEGPVMMSQLTGCDPAAVISGMAVQVAFRVRSERITMPEFRRV